MGNETFLRAERGAISSDWIVLTAGILLLGTILVLSVMENSSGYLMDEFKSMNQEYAKDAVTVSELDQPTNTRN